jgi:hypothetical protein
MKRAILSALLVLSLLTFIPQQALAQRLCAQAEDEEECKAAVNEGLDKKGILATELEAEEAQAAVAKLMAGNNNDEVRELVADEVARELLGKVAPEIAALPGASAAFEDFLNRFRIGLTSEGNDGQQALAFDFTDFFGLATEDGYKLQAVARDPVLFEALSTELSEEDRDKRTEGLGAFDDVLVSFAYSPSTPRFGTNLGASQILIDELFARFLAQDTELARAADAARGEQDRLAASLNRDFPEAFDDNGVLHFAGITDDARQQKAREVVERAAVAEATRLASLHQILTRSGFFKIADLVANQPQIVVKATGTVRDELTGPQEATLKVSYEQGFVNMNSLRRKLRSCKPEELTACYTSYLTSRRAQVAKAQNRLTFSLDWTSQKDYDPTVDGVSLDLAGKERWTLAATFGRNLRVDVNGKYTSRVDLTGSWEDWSDDPLHQDRGLANLSFTQKVTSDMSLVLGAVWASKPELRGEVDEEVSARFGLTYRFLDQEGKEIMRGN